MVSSRPPTRQSPIYTDKRNLVQGFAAERSSGADGEVLKMRSKHVERKGVLLVRGFLISVIAGVITLGAQYPSVPQITASGLSVVLEDFAAVPLSSITTGTYPQPIDMTRQLARVNFLRSEPSDATRSASRLFVSDLNRNLYILETSSATVTVADPAPAGNVTLPVSDV